MKKYPSNLLLLNVLPALFVVLLFQTAVSMASQQPDSAPLLLRNAKILDVKKGVFIEGKDILIQDGIIIKIQKSKAKNNARIVDLTGKYLTPGLIDGHIHVTAKYKNNIENTYRDLNYYLTHGITTVRDACGYAPDLLTAQKEFNSGRKLGPNLYFASFMAGDWYYNRGQHIHKEPYTPWEQLITANTNLDSAMIAAKACGATGVKLYHSFDQELLLKVVKAAKSNHLKVWGHTMLYPATPVEVAKSGMEVLSHVSMLEVLRKDSLFYRRNTPMAYKDSVIAGIDITEFCYAMKRNHAILDATLCVSETRDPWVFPLLKRVHEQGVTISAGTDQIVDVKRPYPRLIDELNYFVKFGGFSTIDAIRSATVIGARVVGQEKRVGAIEKGKLADLLVLDENPLVDINAFKKINAVYKSGKLVRPEAGS